MKDSEADVVVEHEKNGALIFAGMQVGVAPGDLALDSLGGSEGRLILSTAYNVMPIWLHVANRELIDAHTASVPIGAQWSDDAEVQRRSLIAELVRCMQVFVACSIALDALYGQLRPFARLSKADTDGWKRNRTGRASQIVEVIRRVYGLPKDVTARFRQNILSIIKRRDDAVHPSLELRQSCTRPDVPVGVDWKFSMYRYDNAERCFRATIEMVWYLYQRRSKHPQLDRQMQHVIDALFDLGVIGTPS